MIKRTYRRFAATAGTTQGIPSTTAFPEIGIKFEKTSDMVRPESPSTVRLVEPGSEPT